MGKIRIALFVVGIFLSSNAQKSFVIKNIKVFDGEAIKSSISVKVNNGIIEKVGEVDDLDVDLVIDGTGKTLIPALSNAHVHAWTPQSLNAAAKAGVLNLMDMHGVEPFQIAMRNLKDSTNYARFYVAGYAATAPEGHGTQFGFPVPTLSKPEDAKAFIDARVRAQVDHIKIIVEPWRKTLTSETVAELIKEAHKAGKIAVVHVSRLEDALDVITNNADGLVHIWWDKPIEAETLNQLVKKKSFFVIPTLLTTLKAFEGMGENAKKYMTKDLVLDQVKKLFDAGIPILAGTDPPNFGINYSTDLYKELQLFAEAGIPLMDVLKSGTSNIARAFNLDKTGFIKKGFIADLVLIDGDPTTDIKAIEKIEIVWKNGEQVIID